jgi:putative endonuclease
MGSSAEGAVVEYLTQLGWHIVDRNLHIGRYELDIVARDGRTLVVVEVRYRGARSLTSGFGSLSITKRLRVRRAGERLWHTQYRFNPAVERMRFDAASVHFDPDGHPIIEYAVAAF